MPGSSALAGALDVLPDGGWATGLDGAQRPPARDRARAAGGRGLAPAGRARRPRARALRRDDRGGGARTTGIDAGSEWSASRTRATWGCTPTGSAGPGRGAGSGLDPDDEGAADPRADPSVQGTGPAARLRRPGPRRTTQALRLLVAGSLGRHPDGPALEARLASTAGGGGPGASGPRRRGAGLDAGGRPVGAAVREGAELRIVPARRDVRPARRRSRGWARWRRTTGPTTLGSTTRAASRPCSPSAVHDLVEDADGSTARARVGRAGARGAPGRGDGRRLRRGRRSAVGVHRAVTRGRQNVARRQHTDVVRRNLRP